MWGSSVCVCVRVCVVGMRIVGEVLGRCQVRARGEGGRWCSAQLVRSWLVSGTSTVMPSISLLSVMHDASRDLVRVRVRVRVRVSLLAQHDA